MLVDMIDQRRRIFAHPEEIGFLLGLFHRPAAVGTDLHAVLFHDLRFREEGLVRHAVPAFIGSFVDVALIVEFFKYFLHLSLMIVVRGANEFVIGNVQGIPDIPDAARDLVHKGLRIFAGSRRFILDLLAVLVRAGLEEDVVALGPAETCDRIRQHDLIAVADMRLARSIGDCGSDVIGFLVVCVHAFLLFRHGR